MPRSDFANRVHVGRAAVQMYRENCAGSRRDRAFDELGIKIAGRGIDVDEHGHGTAIRDRLGRREKRVGRGDYFVIGLDTEGQQPQMESRRSVAERDAVPGAAEIGEFALEGFDFRTDTKAEFWQTRSSAGRISSLNCAYSAFRSRTATFIARRP